MRPTLRTNKTKMVTIKVKFHLSKSDCIYKILSQIRHWKPEDAIKVASKSSFRALMKLAQEELYDEGNREVYLDSMDGDLQEQLVEILNKKLSAFDVE